MSRTLLREDPAAGPPGATGVAPPVGGSGLSARAVSLLRMLLRVYRAALSPLLGPSCRYIPTCSCYADEALAQWGVVRGLGLSAWRILRCHPFSRGGLDPVPRR